MRILLAHNRYQQAGGEDVVFATEARLLRSHGHEVLEFTKDNADVSNLRKFSLFTNTLWSRDSYRELTDLLRAQPVDVVHFHNTLPLISPSALHAAKACGAATIQTLHNYRLLCPSALMFRDGRPCHDCLGRAIAWPGIRHACYRDSRAATAAVAAMTASHRWLKTWQDKVDRYIALTEASRHRFIEGGLPADKLLVKANFLSEDPGLGPGAGDFALFAGRLAPEKGLLTLLQAWRSIGTRLPLKILGDGPLREDVLAAAQEHEGVEWLGSLPRDELLDWVGRASVLIAPSEWEEPFGLVVIEAYAKGTPVIGAAIGSLPSLIEDGTTGYLFRPADAADLVAAVERLLALGDDDGARLRRQARAAYEDKFTAKTNYRILMRIYEEAGVENRASRT